MSDATSLEDLLQNVHRLAPMSDRYQTDRCYSCLKCKDTGFVRELVGQMLGNLSRIYESVARCRCAEGDKQSPSIARCSDAFWWGTDAADAARVHNQPVSSSPVIGQSHAHTTDRKVIPFTGTIVEELDP